MTETDGILRQVAALPWRRNKQRAVEVLLITSRETKRWVIPKGWPMEDLKDHNAAKREAYEEAGIKGRIQREPLGTYVYGKRKRSGVTVDLTVTVYALKVEDMLSRWPEHKERKRQWFALDEAALAVAEPGLRELLRQFEP